MTRKIVVRPAGMRDLDEQAEYIAANSSIETALRFQAAAQETFRLLSAHPRIGRNAQLRNPFFAKVRMFAVKGFGRHIVFYRPYPRRIEILRVIHGARDFEAILQA